MNVIDGKYEIVRQLGAGAMGSVFEASHRGTGRRVAVKVILDEARLDPGMTVRFEREARAAGSIESEHITQVLDAGIDGETKTPYLVMELLSGEDVDALLRRLGPLRSDLALRIVAQLLEGLERAHEAGIVHRDIKPANLFLAKKDKRGARVVKVCDFGIAKVKVNPLGGKEHALTQSSSLLGSPAYMSPEQAKGAKDIDARADVWSAGIVLYQLLAGKTPHGDAETLGLLLLAICAERVAPIRSKAPWVEPELEAILKRALEPERDQRYESARAMLDALLAFLPNGTAIDDAMLVPVTDEERMASPAMAIPVASEAETQADKRRTDTLPAVPLASVEASTGPEATPPPELLPPGRAPSRKLALGIAIAAGVLTSGALAFSLGGGRKTIVEPLPTPSEAPVTAPSPSATPSEAPPIASSVAVPSSSAPPTRTLAPRPSVHAKPVQSAKVAPVPAPDDTIRRTFE